VPACPSILWDHPRGSVSDCARVRVLRVRTFVCILSQVLCQPAHPSCGTTCTPLFETLHTGGFSEMDPLLGGPLLPPNAHPHWQGSISSHWMDAGSGFQRGFKNKSHDAHEGTSGIARQGFGAYSTDVAGRLAHEGKTGIKACSSAPGLLVPWGDHPAEVKWRSCRRSLEWSPAKSGTIAQPGGLGAAGLPAHKTEPTILSKRPPYVQRNGTYVTRHVARALGPEYDAEAERFNRTAAYQAAGRYQRQALLEDQRERRMVLDLEAWERSHVYGPLGAHGIPGASPSKKAAALAELAGTTPAKRAPLNRSASDARLEFCRQRV